MLDFSDQTRRGARKWLTLVSLAPSISYKSSKISRISAYDHTTMNTPVLV